MFFSCLIFLKLTLAKLNTKKIEIRKNGVKKLKD